LKAKLAHAAIDNGRSMNAEILARLEHSFAPDPLDGFLEALQPAAKLSDADRKHAAQLLRDFAGLLAKA
ncbi:MAG: Arc family DNA-binding protein, partial [Rhizobiales bacterium]|nr:Arc family DNA-binding protein [Hyphomicrobiales bacterium]